MSINDKPKWLEDIFPFKSNYLKVGSNLNMHYIDEGSGDVILMLHGNPTWSFFYRNLIGEFSKTNRVIVPDHIGCGLSDKPQDWDYILENHISNVEKLITDLNIEKLILVVHDWGGAIGFGLLERRPDLAQRIVLFNTAAYTSTYIAPQINICRIPFLGEKVIRTFNAFAWPSTFMSVTKKLNKNIKDGFLFPYDSYKNRIATAKFVTDIPMKKAHRSYATLERIEKSLSKHTCPKLILWGKKDFCFNEYFLNRWIEIYPDAKRVEFENAGHYVIEDAKDEVISEMRNFI